MNVGVENIKKYDVLQMALLQQIHGSRGQLKGKIIVLKKGKKKLDFKFCF